MSQNNNPSPKPILAVFGIFAFLYVAGAVDFSSSGWMTALGIILAIVGTIVGVVLWQAWENGQTLNVTRLAPRGLPRGAASQRADRLGAFVENIDMTTLLDRDGWQCGICKQPIDPKLRHPNRMAGTLDHIIPLNQGGQHHYGNAQAAHYACNSAKGDKLTRADLARYRAMNGDG